MGRSVIIFGSIPKSGFDVFLDLVILPNFNAISLDFYVGKCLIFIYFVHFPCFQEEACLYKKFKCFKNFNDFYIFIRCRKGCTNAYICMGTHGQPLLQNQLMDVYETWQGWSTHGRAHKLGFFLAISAQGRIQGRAKIGHAGGPFLKKNVFFTLEV